MLFNRCFIVSQNVILE